MAISTILLDAGGVLCDEAEHEARHADIAGRILGISDSAYFACVTEAVRCFVPNVYRYVYWHHSKPDRKQFEARYAEHIERFGFVVLVDAHSVASAANRVHGALADEVYLGDCEGATCGTWLRECLASSLRAQGLSVAINQIYKGGYITRHYGAISGVDAIQIEMAQRVYMDEKRPADAIGEPLFADARERLRLTLAQLAEQLRERISGT